MFWSLRKCKRAVNEVASGRPKRGMGKVSGWLEMAGQGFQVGGVGCPIVPGGVRNWTVECTFLLVLRWTVWTVVGKDGVK